VTVSDIVGCSFSSSSSSLQVSPRPPATISTSGSTNICNTGSVTLTIGFALGCTYQWFKDNVAISGATNNAYTATQIGSYKGLVTASNGCTKYSAPKTVKSCKTENALDSHEQNHFEIYPNPTSGQFYFDIPLEFQGSDQLNMYVLNSMGQIILEKIFHSPILPENSVTLPPGTPPGIYLIVFCSESGSECIPFTVSGK
jgi:hypothetical protein